jgi:hypothetical protein
MKIKPAVLISAMMTVQSWAIWVPTPPSKDSPEYVSFNQDGIWSAPGQSSSDSSYTWVDIPDIGFAILPPMASGENGVSAAPATSGQPPMQHSPENSQLTLEQKSKEEASAAQREATIPRFNDVSCDVEYGILSFKPKFGSKINGSGISAKARYERTIDDYSSFGIRLNNEYTMYAKTTYGKIPGNDFLLLGGFYRKTVMSNIEVGGQANASFFLREAHTYTSSGTNVTIDTSTQMDWALNPQVYGIVNYALGPITGYAGAFGGYQYSRFSFTRHQLPYALLLSGGSTFGQYVAAQLDVAASHQFVIIGGQVPIYFSRYFSLTPGVKYPIVFQATNFTNLRITVGLASRF